MMVAVLEFFVMPSKITCPKTAPIIITAKLDDVRMANEFLVCRECYLQICQILFSFMSTFNDDISTYPHQNTKHV